MLEERGTPDILNLGHERIKDPETLQIEKFFEYLDTAESIKQTLENFPALDHKHIEYLRTWLHQIPIRLFDMPGGLEKAGILENGVFSEEKFEEYKTCLKNLALACGLDKDPGDFIGDLLKILNRSAKQIIEDLEIK